MKDDWDEAIVPELQKFYFKVPQSTLVLSRVHALTPTRVASLVPE